MIYIKAYIATLIVFFIIDLLWLGVVARGFYASQLGSLLRENINFAVAGGFYVAYVAGIVYFAVAPALTEGSWSRAAVNGAILGLIAYGTYDMTNLATLRNWPIAMSIVDIGWGCLLTCASAVAGYSLTRAIS